MRSPDYGMIREISKIFSEDETLKMFERMCLIKYFELNVKKAYDREMIPKIPIYLSAGQESISAALATVFRNLALPYPALFGQHRCHEIGRASCRERV